MEFLINVGLAALGLMAIVVIGILLLAGLVEVMSDWHNSTRK